ARSAQGSRPARFRLRPPSVSDVLLAEAFRKRSTSSAESSRKFAKGFPLRRSRRSPSRPSTARFASRMVPPAVRTRVGSGSGSATRRKSSFFNAGSALVVLAALGGPVCNRLEMDHHPAFSVAARDGAVDDDSRIAEMVRGDVAEDVGGHHAEGRPAANLVAERAGAVPQDDPVLVLLDDEKVTLDAVLEIREHFRDLAAVETLD